MHYFNREGIIVETDSTTDNIFSGMKEKKWMWRRMILEAVWLSVSTSADHRSWAGWPITYLGLDFPSLLQVHGLVWAGPRIQSSQQVLHPVL